MNGLQARTLTDGQPAPNGRLGRRTFLSVKISYGKYLKVSCSFSFLVCAPGKCYGFIANQVSCARTARSFREFRFWKASRGHSVEKKLLCYRLLGGGGTCPGYLFLDAPGGAQKPAWRYRQQVLEPRGHQGDLRGNPAQRDGQNSFHVDSILRSGEQHGFRFSPARSPRNRGPEQAGSRWKSQPARAGAVELPGVSAGQATCASGH